MAQKIATVSTVFTACDHLEAAEERWNREDVRNAVGGGGYVVIDPLIRAWRALKPLRKVAPNTPAELLQQVAASLESHITGFTGQAEASLAEAQSVFDATISEISEKLSELESTLDEKEVALRAAETSKSELTDQVGQLQEELNNTKTGNARLMTENDGLRGQVARMVKEHKTATAALQAEHKDVQRLQAQERTRMSEEHTEALANQRRELTALAEQAENRLMKLMDQERQEVKSEMAKLTEDLAGMTQRVQSSRESIVALETNVSELTRSKAKLERDLNAKEDTLRSATSALETQRAQAVKIAREFAAYKADHKLSGEISALQGAVVALQAQMTQSSNPEK